jgi:hypothetical protein
MITNASELHKDVYRVVTRMYCEDIMKSIEEANERDERSIYFYSCNANYPFRDFYDDVRQVFVEHGYKFRPHRYMVAGYGWVTDGEDIYW